MSIAAIVVLYNPDLNLFVKQYNSIREQFDLIVYIDNNSKNCVELSDHIKNDQNVIFKKNKKNRGLGAAHNQGIDEVIRLGYEYVIILDHDSILTNTFVTDILNSYKDLLNENKKIGACGPVYQCAKTYEIYPITKYFGPFIKRIIPTEEPVEASFLISSGCLIPLSVIKSVGKMDEGLFIDYIDVEWSYRAQSMGYKLYAVPNVSMFHSIGDQRMSILGRSISVHSPLRRYYLTRNSVFMIRNKNIPLGYKLREFIFNLLRVFVFCVVSKQRFEYFKLSLIGFYHGIIGVNGEKP